METIAPIWRRPTVAVPLAQAFPQLGEVREFKERICIFNEDRSRLFNVVSPRYEIIPHSDVVDRIESELEELGIDSAISVRTDNGGARLLAEFRLTGLPSVDMGRGDKSLLRINVRNSYDGSWKFGVRLGAYRLICSNGMVIGRKFGEISGKHFSGLKDTLVGPALEDMVKKGATIGSLWEEWSETRVTQEEAEGLLEDAFPKKYLEPILDPGLFPMSKWELYNACTAMATHSVSSLNRRLEFDDIIADRFYNDRPSDTIEI